MNARGALLLFALVALAPRTALAAEEEAQKADATLVLTNWSAGLVVGYRWGSGVLEYEGVRHPFRVRGFSFLDLGVSEVETTGEVFHLKSLEDFAGTYKMFTAGGTWGENELMKDGIVIRVDSKVAGLEAKIGFDWVSFALVDADDAPAAD